MFQRRSSLIGLFLVLTLAVSGWSCATGDPVLKARAAAADSVVLAGETFLLVGATFNALCPTKQLSLETCQGFRLFAAEFQKSYPAIAREYQSQKEVTTATAQELSRLLVQLTGYTKTAVSAGGKK